MRAKLVYFVFILSAAVALLPASASAASPSRNLTLTPAGVNEIVKPGSLNTGSVEVKNGGSVGYNYTAYATPYGVSGEAYTPDFSPVPGAPNVASWLHLASKSGYLPPGGSTIISYKLDVPAGTPPGGYYAAIFVQTKYATNSKSSGFIQINQRIGELFYLQVAGPVKLKGFVASWQTGRLQKPPASATLRLENSGDLHYFSNIEIKFSTIFGASKYVYYGRYVVLPHTTRRIVVAWPHPPFIGLFKVSGSAVTYGNNVLPTKYILIVSPLARLLIIILIAVIVLVFSIASIIKATRKRVKHRTKAWHHD